MTDPWRDPRVVDGLDRQFERRSGSLATGSSHVGWKVGFGAPTSLETMQISAPLLGYLTSSTVLESGASVDSGDWKRGIVEFEVAVYLSSDLGAGAGEDEARAAVGALGPAIELANIDLPIGADGVADILAGDIFHEAVIFGSRDDSRAGIDISGMTGRILIDGEQRASVVELEEITGSYPQIVSTVANTLAARGERLRAGDVIITGSIIPPIPVSEGTNFTFALDPFPPISVDVTG